MKIAPLAQEPADYARPVIVVEMVPVVAPGELLQATDFTERTHLVVATIALSKVVPRGWNN
jgi:hypothetical protein